MVNKSKIQQVLFLIIFINCCVILALTSISISTDYWVLVRPYRQIESNLLDSNNKNSFISKLNKSSISANKFLNDEDYLNAIRNAIENNEKQEEEHDSLPLDLYEKKDCKRFNGKIRFGLFKGVWLLNYAFGCKNRVKEVSIIDMLLSHKIFDHTLWISTILCCSLALFSTFISSVISIFNVFVTPNRELNGPTSLYLWNLISGLFHLMAIIIFSVEFHLYIKKNVLTKDELESGWDSTNRAQLCWSFYLLIASLLFICINIGLIYATVRLKRLTIDSSENKSYLLNECKLVDNSISNTYDNIKQSEYKKHSSDKNIIDSTKNEADNFPNSQDENVKPTKKSNSSIKLKRFIDFIY